ncbi:hypothetical protein [Pseudomonas fluorescens]|uniref:Uncharacterized protein n=1 Tax=Pseudomonas fluorescens TaxID=294 RepID=A0A5E7BB02_PSEFL|nr:hypothetical protein [Pseudomonas fluorescens]VVN86347.1 hypothetical protein PS691_01503 [Pseudomonas fluorescens]
MKIYVPSVLPGFLSLMMLIGSASTVALETRPIATSKVGSNQVIAKAVWYDPAVPGEVFGLVGPRHVNRFVNHQNPAQARIDARQYAEEWIFPAIGTTGPILSGENRCLETVRWPTPDDLYTQWERCKAGDPQQQYMISSDGTVTWVKEPSLTLVADLDVPANLEFYTLTPRPNYSQKLDIRGADWRQ